MVDRQRRTWGLHDVVTIPGLKHEIWDWRAKRDRCIEIDIAAICIADVKRTGADSNGNRAEVALQQYQIAGAGGTEIDFRAVVVGQNIDVADGINGSTRKRHGSSLQSDIART